MNSLSRLVQAYRSCNFHYVSLEKYFSGSLSMISGYSHYTVYSGLCFKSCIAFEYFSIKTTHTNNITEPLPPLPAGYTSTTTSANGQGLLGFPELLHFFGSQRQRRWTQISVLAKQCRATLCLSVAESTQNRK